MILADDLPVQCDNRDTDIVATEPVRAAVDVVDNDTRPALHELEELLDQDLAQVAALAAIDFEKRHSTCSADEVSDDRSKAFQAAIRTEPLSRCHPAHEQPGKRTRGGRGITRPWCQCGGQTARGGAGKRPAIDD